MSDLVGTIVDVVAFDIERGKIAEFARATHAEDPSHRTPCALATATHVVVSGHQRDQAAFVEKLGLELSRILVGSVSWEYERPLRAGDSVVGTRTVIADENREGKHGGTMRLITLETVYVDAAGAVAVRQREVLIERGRG
ncbi:MaoC family dehydratase N-terminal domain-containing protein [Kribbella alba]|uniref:MaoC family dehydratase N-terminal domain-containing protein n=1 Tax=Kribbella alba TaxID=190197 RepID=A0ABP4RDJ0_9ACTN